MKIKLIKLSLFILSIVLVFLSGVVIESSRQDALKSYIINTGKNFLNIIETASLEYQKNNKYPDNLKRINDFGAEIEYEVLTGGQGFGVYIVVPEASLYSDIGMSDEYSEIINLPMLSYVSGGER